MPDRAQKTQRSQPVTQDGADSDRPSSAVQEAQRQAGDAAVARITAENGRPVNDPTQVAKQSVWGADVSATDAQGEELLRDGHTVVRIAPGTRLTVGFDPGGLSIGADPGFVVETLGPTARITNVRYDFATAKFQVYASAHIDLFGAWASIVQSVGARALDQKYRPLLPAALQKAGYSPANDPDLQGTMQGLAGVFTVSGGPAGDPAAAMHRFVDPSAFAQLVAPEELHVPLGTDQLEVFLAKGTRIDLSLDAAGAADKPHLKLLTMRSSSPGIAIRSTGSGVLDSLKGLTLNEIAIQPGGKFAFDYSLDVEQMADGLQALGALLGLAAGESVGPLQQTKLDSIRKELDARLQQEVPPRFRAFLLQFDQALPGFSLTDFFGVAK